MASRPGPSRREHHMKTACRLIAGPAQITAAPQPHLQNRRARRQLCAGIPRLHALGIGILNRGPGLAALDAGGHPGRWRPPHLRDRPRQPTCARRSPRSAWRRSPPQRPGLPSISAGVCARLKSSQVPQREIAASSRRFRPPKPDPLGRFGQRKQGNAGKGRRRAQTPRVKLDVVLEHAGTPCCPSCG